MLSEPLIPANEHFLIWAMLFGLAAFAFWAETTRLGRHLSGVMIAIVIAMVLANVGIIPKSAPAYEVIWSSLVPLGISLLLFKADLRKLIPETKGMFVAFMFGALGTVLGCVLGWMLLPLNEHGSDLVGIFSASYIGGSMNMVAVAEVLEVDSSVLTASVAADNVIGVIYLAVLAVMPALAFLRRWLPSEIIDGEAWESEAVASAESKVDFNPLHVCALIALGLLICASGYGLAGYLGIGQYGILFITAITVSLANLVPARLAKLEGAYEIGMLCMYLFFAVVGTGADIARLMDSALVIAVFAALIVTCHMAVILLAGKLFRLDLAEVIIASNACAAGPASAAALAAGKRWPQLITPAVTLGVLGYVMANFVGVSLAALLS